MSEQMVDRAEVERVVRAMSFASQETTLRRMTANWKVEHYDYAIERLQMDQPDRCEVLRNLYRMLRSERDAADARRSAEEAHAQRHAELSSHLQDLKRPHWSIVPNFWMTAAILVLTAAGTVAAFLTLFRK